MRLEHSLLIHEVFNEGVLFLPMEGRMVGFRVLIGLSVTLIENIIFRVIIRRAVAVSSACWT